MRTQTAGNSSRRARLARAVPKAKKAALGRSRADEMPVAIRCLGVEIDEAMASYVRRRLGFKFGKFAAHITRLTVRFEDVSGPVHAPTVSCRIKIVFPSMASVVVDARQSHVRAAFDEAADTCERAARRTLEKSYRTSPPKTERVAGD